MAFLRFKPTLRKKFGLKLEVLPIPSGDDFRVTMSAEEQARIAREIDANVRQSLQRGTEDPWSLLQSVVSHMADRLNEPESRFHASLVTNVLTWWTCCRSSMLTRTRN
jgi:hypothetical protein